MSAAAGVSDEARAFAESVAGVLARVWEAPRWEPGRATGADGAGGAAGVDRAPDVIVALDRLGWPEVGRAPELAAFAGPAGMQLGRALAPLALVDGLLGGAPVCGGLVRCLGSPPVALARADGAFVARPVTRAEPLASADGLAVHRLLSLGEGVPVDGDAWPIALAAWLGASVGYLAGLGLGALELTIDYVGQRRAFGGTLAALAPVQQLLAGAATLVRGVSLLAADAPGCDALAHAGPAVAHVCATCHQVSGAVGYTLEHPLHRYSQRARALAAWNDVLLDLLG